MYILHHLGAITLSNDSTYHTKTKHINVTYHFICEKLASNKAVLTYVQLKENLVDLMTKGLDLHQHQYLCRKLGFEGKSEVRGSVESDTSDHSDDAASLLSAVPKRTRNHTESRIHGITRNSHILGTPNLGN